MQCHAVAGLLLVATEAFEEMASKTEEEIQVRRFDILLF